VALRPWNRDEGGALHRLRPQRRAGVLALAADVVPYLYPLIRRVRGVDAPWLKGSQEASRGVPRCPLRGELRRRLVAQPGMGPDGVVVVAPGGKDGPGRGQRCEQGFVQAFVAQPSVEALHERVLGRLAGDDIAPFDMVLLGRPPAIHRDCDSGDVVGNRMSQP
jgi:hypothetical protein